MKDGTLFAYLESDDFEKANSQQKKTDVFIKDGRNIWKNILLRRIVQFLVLRQKCLKKFFI